MFQSGCKRKNRTVHIAEQKGERENHKRKKKRYSEKERNFDLKGSVLITNHPSIHDDGKNQNPGNLYPCIRSVFIKLLPN